MKKCTICRQDKALADFNKKPSTKDGYQTKCRKCSKRLAKARYYDNRDTEMKRIKDRQEDLANRFYEFKRTLRCEFCPETTACCLDFHHRDPNSKEFNIAFACRQGYSWDKLMEEVNKCVVACANCHRKIHHGLIDCPLV